MPIAARLSLATLACLAAWLPAQLSAEEPAKPAAPPPTPAASTAPAGVVADGRRISIEYTLKTDDGKVADTNVGGQPLVYEQGKGEILTALEKALAGLKKGDTKQVVLTPEQGYGVVREDLRQTVPADKIPEDARKPGTMLMAQAESGEQRPVRIHEVKGDQIVIDLNHPLAGQTLHFDVKVVDVQ